MKTFALVQLVKTGDGILSSSARDCVAGAVVYKAGKVQNGGYVVPHPHVLGRTATWCRVHWGPVSGWWCGPSRVHPHPHLFEASSPERGPGDWFPH